MKSESFYCRQCEATIDERDLICETFTRERCPHCRSTLRQGTDAPGAQRMTTAIEDVAAIDEWLERYTAETGRRVVRRPDAGPNNLLWTIETPYEIALECAYSEHRPQIAIVRTATTKQGQQVAERLTEVSQAAAGQGFQFYGSNNHGSFFAGPVESQVVWGLAQVVMLNGISTELLDAIAKRLSEATEVVVAGLRESRN